MSSASRGRADYLDLGDWNAICAECGRKGKASEMVQLPDGIPGARMWVHPEHYLRRNPQDFVRGIADKSAAPWVQDPAEIYADYCTTISGVAGWAIAGCALAGYYFNPEEGSV